MHCVLLAPSWPDRLQEAMRSGASTVVVDLMQEAGSIEECRAVAAAWLRGARSAAGGGPVLYVRVHDLSSGRLDADLAALCPAVPDGIMLPCCRNGADLQHLGAKLAVHEAEHGLPDGGIGIIAIAASRAADVLAMSTYAGASRRLRALAWDRDALARDLGVDPQANVAPLAHARAMTILAARAAGVPPLDDPDAADDDTLKRRCARGRRDGFRGALTRNVAQARLVAATYQTKLRIR